MLEPFVKMGNKSIRRNLLDQLRSLNKDQKHMYLYLTC